VTDVQRSIERTRAIKRTRALRSATVLVAILGAVALAVSLAEGSAALAGMAAVTIAAILVLIIWQTRLIRSRRREVHRPRMTPGDYRRLREMEIELGWEPSKPPVPGTVLTPAGIVMAGLSAPGWSTLNAAAEHFAALARVGRESCISFCPICAERAVRSSQTDAQWIEKGRWNSDEP
jgi:hypothetical protein